MGDWLGFILAAVAALIVALAAALLVATRAGHDRPPPGRRPIGTTPRPALWKVTTHPGPLESDMPDPQPSPHAMRALGTPGHWRNVHVGCLNARRDGGTVCRECQPKLVIGGGRG